MSGFVQRTLNSNNNFNTQIESMCDNTLLFENCSEKTQYTNSEISHMDETETNLTYFRNVIIEKYHDRVMNKRTVRYITTDEAEEFDMNPYKASYELLGTVDYWWLILYVNRKSSVTKFTRLKDKIYLPDISDIKSFMENELKKNTNLS